LSGLSVGIFTTPFPLLCIIIFTLVHLCNKISLIMIFYGDHKVSSKRK
jgi:hypothetical protein